MTADTIKIGAILGAVGNNAAPAQYVHDGIMLAVEEVNKRGGVNGSRVEATFAEGGSDAQSVSAAFNRLEAGVHPLFYLSYSTGIGVTLAPLAEKGQAVLIGLVTAAVDFTRGRDWVFRYWPLGPAYITPLVRILQDLHAKNLGIIYQNDDFGKEQQALMTKAFLQSGGTVVVQQFEVKDAAAPQQIAALKDKDAIYIAGSGAQLLNVTRQLKDAGYKGSVLMPAGGADPALFGVSEMSGVYVSAPLLPNPSYLYAREAGAQFLARYKKPFNQWAANGYDAVKLICGLLEDRAISRQGLRDALAAGFEYSGVFGQVRLKSGEHDLTFTMYPTQILNSLLSYR
jgi:branched-chain amino acid transport system substrate-binding protein